MSMRLPSPVAFTLCQCPLLVCPVPNIIMKLFAIASVVALSSILVSGSTIQLDRRGPPSICGEGSELLDETSVSHGGKTILVSTSTCPPTKRDTTVPKRSAIDIDKRQNICTDGGCTVICATTPATASLPNCATLIDYIASYAPQIRCWDNPSWAFGTCGVLVANADTVAYTICYSTIASDATLAVGTCFGTTAAAACIGSGAAGDNYVVAIESEVDWELEWLS
ncbi:hypothetical protein BC826DRAFT_970640 [Russula brevipes]|nr:hypothetical protein BC826DRAFT_970640 [Russula brevipes]